MRTLANLSALSVLVAVGCIGGPAAYQAPPKLRVTSPMRSLVQANPGQVIVTGTVQPSDEGVPIDSVKVNNVPATLNADGSFQATIQIGEGASFIETVARDREGGQAFDTRAVHTGEQRNAGTNIDNAITMSMSTQSFTKLSAAAGPIVKGLDIGAMLAPLQPMQHSGDENGEDCLFERLFINNVTFSDVQISLTPVRGGLSVRAQIDNLDVPGSVRWKVACLGDTTNLRVTANRVVVSGTLLVSPNGTAGFKTDLVNQNVSLTNIRLTASGLPGTILDLINVNSLLNTVAGKALELAMEPLVNQALGALAGPKQIAVLGKTLTVAVAPSDISFESTGALVTLDTTIGIAGAERAKFTFTANGRPTMDPGNGIQLGLADDLANEMLSEAQAIGLLNISMPASSGTFDNAEISMTLPPMLSADPADGSLKVILGDMIATFTSHGVPVAKAAINASIGLQVESANNGYAVALKLGTPTIKFTVLDDIPNLSLMDDADLAKASETCLTAQLGHITALLVNIPVPTLAGIQMRNLTMGSDNGFLMVKGSVE